jgi:hypothetical protein
MCACRGYPSMDPYAGGSSASRPGAASRRRMEKKVGACRPSPGSAAVAVPRSLPILDLWVRGV